MKFEIFYLVIKKKDENKKTKSTSSTISKTLLTSKKLYLKRIVVIDIIIAFISTEVFLVVFEILSYKNPHIFIIIVK
jgi:hypothetical protein